MFEGKNEEYIIELKNITKSYVKDTPVIEDFNLSVKKGEFVTFLGPSGCGKTTVLRMIGGFEMPSSGQIMLDGKDISNLLPYKRPVNTVFQKYALFPFMNIYDNIAFGLKMKKMKKDEIEKKVRRVLEIVDLEGFEKRKIDTLSGGQQQRIAIARAIVNEPEILLLDEPLGALDYKMRQEMQLELKNMHKELGITFIYVTHDQEEALTMSDKIVVMASGRIQQIGTPEEIYKQPKNVFVADFIGQSNIFTGFMVGEREVAFCGKHFACANEFPAGTKVDAVIRPEDISFCEEGKGMLTGVVDSSAFKGTYYDVVVMRGKNEISVQSPVAKEPGTSVDMLIPADKIHVMPYDVTKNHYIGVFDENLNIDVDEMVVEPDLSALFPGAVRRDNELFSDKGVKMELAGKKVMISFHPEDAQLSDDASAGLIKGNIVSIIYKGDHYSYIVRSATDMDYCVDDEWLWNIGDYVSVVVPKEKINYELRK